MHTKFFRVLFVLFCLAAALTAQDNRRFEGYSFEVDANDADYCAVRFLPNRDDLNAVRVFVAGTNQQTPASGLTACDGSRVETNKVSPNGVQKWCFEGAEQMYEIRLSNGASFLWYALGKDTGFYNLMDFRPVTRAPGPTPRYEFSTPRDFTATFRNALAYIASRQGGTLLVPDGDYVVGTLDGNARDPRFNAITLPPGVTIQGASGNFSAAGSNMPNGKSSTRIRLRHDRQSIFRIGGCTNRVTLRNIELLGNSPLPGEQPRSVTETYGIAAIGKWAIEPATKAQHHNTSHFLRVESVSFQNFDIGLNVRNVNADDKCKPAEQQCNQWNFDYVKVDHAFFVNNRTGIYVDTFNTDWNITNSVFAYMAALAPGTGMRIKRAGTVLIEQSFGGGYNYGAEIGGTFIHIDTLGAMTIINSGVEKSQKSIYTAPMGSISSVLITAIGSVWSDPIELGDRLNFVSMGNQYGAATIRADPKVTITSIGDKFCFDPVITPGLCRDASGNAAKEPSFGAGARPMFRTGRLPEGTGQNYLERQPNFFGNDVEIGGGLMQHDPNVTFRDITAWATPTEGKPRARDGAIVYCKDCRKSSSGVCTQGTAGTDGTFAKRINGQWRCD